MRTQYKMRSKLVASVAAAAMAASMVVAVPGAAFATYDTGSISANATTVNAHVGTQVEMADYFDWSASGGDGAWHVDYKVTDGSGATVNKHSGILTPTAEGSVVVTAYLTGIETPTGNKNNPCNSDEAKCSATVTVSVAAADAYGYQGNKNSIKMTSPAVASYAGSNSEGWKNVLSGSSSTISGDYYHFTVAMTNGFKNYNTALSFAGINAGMIQMTDGVDSASATLNVLNAGDLYIASVDNDSKTIDVAVAKSKVSLGTTKLVFNSGFRGNNANNTLGTTVTFVIK